jgi:hypothetical protein
MGRCDGVSVSLEVCNVATRINIASMFHFTHRCQPTASDCWRKALFRLLPRSSDSSRTEDTALH